MKIRCLILRLREEGNVKASLGTLPRTRVGGEGVCERPRRTRREMRHRGQEERWTGRREVGGDQTLQGNLKVGQLELGNKTRLENHLLFDFVTKSSSISTKC